MSQYRIITYSLSSQTKIVMYDEQQFNLIEILFQDQVLLSDGHSKPYLVLLQLTSESLIIQPIDTNNNISKLRNVIIKRDPITRSLGFSIKGGKDTGKLKAMICVKYKDRNRKLMPNLLSLIMNIHMTEQSIC